MKERRSVRSFNGEPLSSSVVSDLRKVIDESYTLFGGNVTIRLKSFDLKENSSQAPTELLKVPQISFFLE